MKTTRKRYSSDFKAKVALEAIRGEMTLSELGAKHGIHPTVIGGWKRQATEGLAGVFDAGEPAAKTVSEAEVEKLTLNRASDATPRSKCRRIDPIAFVTIVSHISPPTFPQSFSAGPLPATDDGSERY